MVGKVQIEYVDVNIDDIPF